MSRTQFVHPDGTVEGGPNLPKARDRHCMVNLNDGRVMIIGGHPTLYTVTVYHHSNNSFDRAPYLQYGRYNHACAVFNSPLHGNRPVVLVTGGASTGNRGYKTEVLDYTNPSAEWEESEYYLM